MAKGKGFGKTILFGEHFVVYGKTGIVAGLEKGIEVEVEKSDEDEVATNEYKRERMESLKAIKRALGVDAGVRIKNVHSELPAGGGLGSSAALAVAIARAIDNEFDLGKSEKKICDAAYESERIFHGTPSGIDNTAATYGGVIVFTKREGGNVIKRLRIKKPFYIVIGISGKQGITKELVGMVRKRKEENEKWFSNVLKKYAQISKNALDALGKGDLKKVGKLMDENQILLREIGVSTKELEEIISVANKNGALGAKLTGAGGGGCAIALAENEEKAKKISSAIKKAGYRSFYSKIG
ncbi:MAG: mevalonate kinase [Candidatus Anstonellales archaeon]